ncbi:MAG TPA: condensation domain-containing protein, partial [Vicinamibacterales bacterium]|nr:condensation domain-containing protein [Vicinamibacterales bacterium]
MGNGTGDEQGQAKYRPVSFAQQRLWFLDQLMPGNAFYNEHTSVRLKFAVNASALERSLAEIARRHESLRTTFVDVEGQPVQVVAPSGTIPLSTIDLRALNDSDRESAALERAAEEAGKPFDLQRGPLVRTTLLRIGEFDYLFLITMHHIVSDGWSLSVFGRELQTLYAAFELGHASPLRPLPIQYADFAVWQRRRLQGPVLEEHLSYWKQQLADASTLQMATDRPRPPMPTFRGAVHTVEYPAALLTALRALSQGEGATLFMTLLAGFQLLLARYTGQEDIVVGVPIVNRNRSELEGLIGFFVNTLAMRTRLTGDPTVRALLARVRSMALDAYAHQDLPFEKLVEELHPRRDLARNPVFQVVFQLVNTPGAGPATQIDRTATVERSTAKFDLTVHLGELASGLYARFEYSTDLFDRCTIERLADHYGRLLEEMVVTPDASVFDLPLMTRREQQRLVGDWNRTHSDYPRDASLQELFEGQAARTPDAIAVRFDPLALTYQELNRRANRLARRLRSAGAGPDVLIAVAVERSVDMVIAVLGVIKAGAAYVPCDPSYPPARLALMLNETRAPLLVTQSHLQARLPASGAQVINVDADAVCDVSDDENVPSGSTAENLAYVMYTSGSTGVPKGAVVLQRGVLRLVLATNYVSLGPSDRIAQVSSFSFDAATFEIWGALLT